MSSEAHRPPKPVYPHQPTEDTLLFRQTRDRVGFHRDESWLDLVRGDKCVKCGRPGEPHHVFGSVGSKKTSDLAVVPLCREHHELVENDRWFKNECMGLLVVYLVDMLAKAKGLK